MAPEKLNSDRFYVDSVVANLMLPGWQYVACRDKFQDCGR